MSLSGIFNVLRISDRLNARWLKWYNLEINQQVYCLESFIYGNENISNWVTGRYVFQIYVEKYVLFHYAFQQLQYSIKTFYYTISAASIRLSLWARFVDILYTNEVDLHLDWRVHSEVCRRYTHLIQWKAFRSSVRMYGMMVFESSLLRSLWIIISIKPWFKMLSREAILLQWELAQNFFNDDIFKLGNSKTTGISHCVFIVIVFF